MSQSAFEALCLILDTLEALCLILDTLEALCLILNTLADVPGGDAVLELLAEGREQEAEALMIRLSEAEAK